MKCVIPGVNCKILGKAIHALAKISEEMYIEPREKSLSFRSVSPSSSAYCDFTFEDVYFSSYSPGNLEEEDALKCKISMKSALTVFKSLPVIEKLVETCHIRLEPDADQLIFVFVFKNSVMKTFFLPIIDCEQLSGPLAKNNLPNKLSAKSRVLTDVVQNFQQNLMEITLDVTPQKLLMRNYVDDTSTVANSTRTQLAVTIGEFDEYKISQEARITFCLKEFKAILSFADAVSLPLNVYFETEGRPVFFDLKHPSFQANLVLSTLNPNGDDASTITERDTGQTLRRKAGTKQTPRVAAKSARKRATNKSIVTNKSANLRKNITSTTSQSDRPDRLANRMEVDVHDASISETNGPCFRNVNVPLMANDAASKSGQTRKYVEKHLITPEIFSNTRASTSKHFSPLISSFDSVSNRMTGPSIFSQNWKRPTDSGNNNNNNNVNANVAMDEDEIPASPPPPVKKAKMIFRKCYEATFDSGMLPGHDTILADDSD